MKNPTVLLVIAGEHFQPIEYETTKNILQEAGYNVVTASTSALIAHASDGSIASVDLTIGEIQISNYDGIFLIGGRGAHGLLDVGSVYDLMRKAARAENIKAYGAICYSCRILAHAGLMRGQRATGWDGDNQLTAIFNNAGVNYIDLPVVVDGKLITSKGPETSAAFGYAIVQVINQALNFKL